MSLYDELNDKYPVRQRYEHLYRQMQALLSAMPFKDNAYINEDLLGAAIVDYFEDIDRLKKFEGIKRTSTSKIYAYTAYWILKRKPIQLKALSEQDDRQLYVNEIIIAFILISDMFSERGRDLKSGNKSVWKFFDLLYYNLKYREYTQKSLELMIEAYYLGAE